MENSAVTRTVYRFGEIGYGHFGYLVLKADGRVGYYRNSNEHSYAFDGQNLSFLNADSVVTSSLVYHQDANCFLSADQRGLYLLPVLKLQPPEDPPKIQARLMINTIPKSGTYLIEAAMRALGFNALRLHLWAFSCDDHRGIPDVEMHIAAQQRRRDVPAGSIAHAMETGEVVVGHIEHHGELDAIVEAEVTLVHCVRNLRDVLVSLFRFKDRVVAPVSAADAAWHGLPGPAGFQAFLAYAGDRDIAYLAHVARTIAERSEPKLRFEDLVEGRIPGIYGGATRADRPGFSGVFSLRGQPGAWPADLDALNRARGLPGSMERRRRGVFCGKRAGWG